MILFTFKKEKNYFSKTEALFEGCTVLILEKKQTKPKHLKKPIFLTSNRQKSVKLKSHCIYWNKTKQKLEVYSSDWPNCKRYAFKIYEIRGKGNAWISRKIKYCGQKTNIKKNYKYQNILNTWINVYLKTFKKWK